MVEVIVGMKERVVRMCVGMGRGNAIRSHVVRGETIALANTSAVPISIILVPFLAFLRLRLRYQIVQQL
jgi:hypothetical protein